ncbi:uncharacterized [Tachysurus ichikawai]
MFSCPCRSCSLVFRCKVCMFCPSHPCPFKGAAFRVRSGPHSLCSLIQRDKLLPALPSPSDGKLPRRPLVGDAVLPRTLGNKWAAAGRERGLGGFIHLPHLTTTTSPPPTFSPPSCSHGSI